MTDIPTIAAGLSEAQRNAVLRLTYDLPYHPDDTGVSRSMLARLVAKDLAVIIRCTPRHGDRRFNGYALSETGREVRSYLTRQSA